MKSVYMVCICSKKVINKFTTIASCLNTLGRILHAHGEQKCGSFVGTVSFCCRVAVSWTVCCSWPTSSLIAENNTPWGFGSLSWSAVTEYVCEPGAGGAGIFST
jgi:hypothetical protein